MDKEYFIKCYCLGVLGLRSVNQPDISQKIILTPTGPFKDLFEKNNSIKTGYENFFLKKGLIKLFPNKDFDIVNKNIVCLKCYQQFPSKKIYRDHVGTIKCSIIPVEPNPIYLKYKYKPGRRKRLPNSNFIDPEMLFTLQTRNKTYSSSINDKTDKKVRSNIRFKNKKRAVRPKKTVNNTQVY
ncbi:uncharacterized protein LOC126898384 [Daktulosphaira vitifoliae]|uniref:uncharacterized protein LOC126898384 n=1 Tax=Daktulosphaira vitifoliae TaxID=58002 RepID=UPI0021AAB4DA|nr:uncharacterized protein LOC126898384 [Daktulosphaira vitifoliae]